jgi:cellulose synthase/poly-beta-1,6-N-acetylglucosamine synthase-like glycosyltransferase
MNITNITIMNGVVWFAYFLSLFFLIYWLLFFLEKRAELKIELIKKRPKLVNFPTVTISVPAFNEEKHIIKTLKSLVEIDYPRNRFEIFVVNDCSTDNTKDIVRKFMNDCKNQKKYSDIRIRLINHKTNKGKAEGLNTAIANSSSEFFSCIDADSAIEKDALLYMINDMIKDPKLAIVTPVMKVDTPKNWLQKFQRVEYMSSMFVSRLMGHIDSIYVAPGPFSLYRMSALKKLGKFDGRRNIEDQEIAWRAQKHHLKMRQCAHAFVYTIAPDTIKRFTRQRTRWYRGAIMTIYDYKDLAFNKKYGEFGMFQIPLMIFSYVLSFIALITLGYYIIKPLYQYIYNLFLVRFDILTQFRNIHFNFNILDVEIMQIIMIYGALLIAVLMLYFASRHTNDRVRKYGSIYIIPYFFLYYIIVSFIVIKSLFEILFRKKQKW